MDAVTNQVVSVGTNGRCGARKRRLKNKRMIIRRCRRREWDELGGRRERGRERQ